MVIAEIIKVAPRKGDVVVVHSDLDGDLGDLGHMLAMLSRAARQALGDAVPVVVMPLEDRIEAMPLEQFGQFVNQLRQTHLRLSIYAFIQEQGGSVDFKELTLKFSSAEVYHADQCRWIVVNDGRVSTAG